MIESFINLTDILPMSEIYTFFAIPIMVAVVTLVERFIWGDY